MPVFAFLSSLRSPSFPPRASCGTLASRSCALCCCPCRAPSSRCHTASSTLRCGPRSGTATTGGSSTGTSTVAGRGQGRDWEGRARRGRGRACQSRGGESILLHTYVEVHDWNKKTFLIQVRYPHHLELNEHDHPLQRKGQVTVVAIFVNSCTFRTLF